MSDEMVTSQIFLQPGLRQGQWTANTLHLPVAGVAELELADGVAFCGRSVRPGSTHVDSRRPRPSARSRPPRGLVWSGCHRFAQRHSAAARDDSRHVVGGGLGGWAGQRSAPRLAWSTSRLASACGRQRSWPAYRVPLNWDPRFDQADLTEWGEQAAEAFENLDVSTVASDEDRNDLAALASAAREVIDRCLNEPPSACGPPRDR